MKHLYTAANRIVVAIAFIFLLQTHTKAQLVAGDIAFTGYIANASTTDEFSFVVTVNIPPSTQISFTDNGWLSTNVFRAGEQTCTWTSPASMIPAGREIRLFGPSAGAVTAVFAGNGSSAGTVSGSMPSFATSGDQVIAYTGLVSSPNIIAGIHMNVYSTDLGQCGNTTLADWDPTCITDNGNFSRRPPALTAGTTAVWIGTEGTGGSEQDNARFNCTGPLGTRAQVLAAVSNSANWQVSSIAPPTFSTPSNCTFMGLAPLPVKLESFTGKLNTDKTVTLQWKVALQENIREYVVEESADGINYYTLGTVAANNELSYTYTLADGQVNAGKNYYRLRAVEMDGKLIHSNVVLINLQEGIRVNVYPSPVTDKLTIQQFGSLQYKTAVLADGHGKILQQVKLTGTDQTISMSQYTAGIYFLRMDDGTVFKILKQ